MHELSLADAVVRIACAHAGGRRIEAVELKVGHLRNVVPEALAFAFALVAEGTEAEGAELMMDEVPAAGICRGCGTEGELEAFPLACGACAPTPAGDVATERAVVANTRSAFATYKAATDAIASNQVAVSANELALDGARAENSVGTRTILDVLNAEQELLNAQVALVTARRDQYVAGFQLLNAMGQAEADDLGLEGGPLYDPLGNYRRVAGDWNDWSGSER